MAWPWVNGQRWLRGLGLITLAMEPAAAIAALRGAAPVPSMAKRPMRREDSTSRCVRFLRALS